MNDILTGGNLALYFFFFLVGILVGSSREIGNVEVD